MAVCAPPTLYTGAQPTVEFTHRDIDGVLTDPTTIVVKFGLQGGTPVTYTHPHSAITHVSLGVWRFTPPAPLSAGTYWATVTAAAGGNAVTQQIKVVVHGTHS